MATAYVTPYLPGTRADRLARVEGLRIAKESARIAAEQARIRVTIVRDILTQAEREARRLEREHDTARAAWLAVVENRGGQA